LLDSLLQEIPVFPRQAELGAVTAHKFQGFPARQAGRWW